jgi:hypothetical protein
VLNFIAAAAPCIIVFFFVAMKLQANIKLYLRRRKTATETHRMLENFMQMILLYIIHVSNDLKDPERDTKDLAVDPRFGPPSTA